ncbi:hypothetical protein KY285_010783 [Solanum tuberosum]|nr:hypothetical protein KY289_011360 [Solanum tuberosum]KAH0735076.1 hypothetical protein KY285_010783 [Solanum tuberosum]
MMNIRPRLNELVITNELPGEDLPQGEGASAAPNHREEPLLKGPTLDEPVIAKEVSAEELPQGKGASVGPNHQEELLLKSVVIQRPPIEKLSTGEGESATPHAFQGQTLDEVVFAKDMPAAEEVPQGERASAAPNDQEEPRIKRVVIQMPPLEELSIGK